MVDDLAGKAHWDTLKGQAKPRLPSKRNAALGDLTALLEPLAKPGSRVFEVGCAPGKFLLWCSFARHADAYGLEYAQDSHGATVRLFEAAYAIADIHADDLMQTTFEFGSSTWFTASVSSSTSMIHDRWSKKTLTCCGQTARRSRDVSTRNPSVHF
jgi:hypothetical protein